MPNLLLKRELEKFIKEAGFKYYKFYYPLSDYKNVNSIFTDEFMPKSNNSKLIYPVNYNEDSIVLFNEINVIKQICDNGEFKDFTNSYLVELSNEENENDIKFVNYNIFRKDKYKLTLIMKKDIVEKYATTSVAKEHIKNIEKYIKHLEKLGFTIIDKIENEKVISKIIKTQELDKKIVSEIKEDKIEQAYKEIEKWYIYIKERLEREPMNGIDIFEKYKIEVPGDIKARMKFVKNGYIDLSFENVFYEDEYLFYDQEWYFENVPLEFILYRAINNLYTYNSSRIEPKVKKNQMFTEFNLVDFCQYFEELEQEIQKEILNEEEIKKYRDSTIGCYKKLEELYSNSNELIKFREQYKSLEEQYEALNMQYKILKTDLNILKDEKNNIKNNYEQLLYEYNNSYGWKIIKGFRKILGRK